MSKTACLKMQKQVKSMTQNKSVYVRNVESNHARGPRELIKSVLMWLSIRRKPDQLHV